MKFSQRKKQTRSTPVHTGTLCANLVAIADSLRRLGHDFEWATVSNAAERWRGIINLTTMSLIAAKSGERARSCNRSKRDLLRETGGVGIEWYGRAATALYRAYSVARKLAGAKTGGGRSDFALDLLRNAGEYGVVGWVYAAIRGCGSQHRNADAAEHSRTLDSTNLRGGLHPPVRADCGLASARRMVPEQEYSSHRGSGASFGARLPDGTAAGSVGDLSVYSFNPTKILECGGGALLIRSAESSFLVCGAGRVRSLATGSRRRHEQERSL